MKVKLSASENEEWAGEKVALVLSGLDAINYKWADVKKTDKKKLKLPAVKELTTYAWLLSDE
eukprot:5027582-Amphidinium_carterae.1